MSDRYGYARAFDPNTGDVSFDASRSTWATHPPALQRVLIALRTPLGGCLLDPTLGCDWGRVQKAGPSAGATCRSVILAGLQPLVADGSIRDVKVKADLKGASLLYEVTYTDVRLQKVQTVPGQV